MPLATIHAVIWLTSITVLSFDPGNGIQGIFFGLILYLAIRRTGHKSLHFFDKVTNGFPERLWLHFLVAFI
jgi:hypothetical protein